MLTFHIVTLFPEFFASPLSSGLMKRAQDAGILSFSFHNPRDRTEDRHHHVDDTPYGGGVGMIMQVEPVAKTLRAIERPGRMVLLSPAGKPFTQEIAVDLAREENITLICPRYEGLDARIEDLFPLDVISLSDAVLNSGDSAALCVIEAVSRLRPGFMGKQSSACEESFSASLLEYPQYTRPEEFEGLRVPSVLLSGHHKNITAWRRRKAVERTAILRSDLLSSASLTDEDRDVLRALPEAKLGRNMSFCLVHYPVYLEGRKKGASSLTNLDVHDIARISATYGLGTFYVVSPLTDQLELLDAILAHWGGESAKTRHPDRARALSRVQKARSVEEAVCDMTEQCGVRPTVLASTAKWDGHDFLSPKDVRSLLMRGGVLFCLGTAQGLADEVLRQCDGLVRPLRFLGYNHLSVRSAAAIYADRILGDFD